MRTVWRMSCASPAWKPQAMLAEVTTVRRAWSWPPPGRGRSSGPPEASWGGLPFHGVGPPLDLVFDRLVFVLIHGAETDEISRFEQGRRHLPRPEDRHGRPAEDPPAAGGFDGVDARLGAADPHRTGGDGAPRRFEPRRFQPFRQPA